MQSWYPITVATSSFYIKELIGRYLMETEGHTDSLNYKFHDFGFRGTSSWEESAIGAMANLTQFHGTDTVSGSVMETSRSTEAETDARIL